MERRCDVLVRTRLWRVCACACADCMGLQTVSVNLAARSTEHRGDKADLRGCSAQRHHSLAHTPPRGESARPATVRNPDTMRERESQLSASQM
eukprot:52305-Rhodomonas_salina.1